MKNLSLSEYFPVFHKLSEEDREKLLLYSVLRSVPKGTLIRGSTDNCLGLLVIRSGQVRVYLSSEEGREVTAYRLFERDICLFSASCMMPSIQFDLMISAEKDTEYWIIPPHFYRELMERSTAIANYTNELMASRFTEVMWMMEQVMWKSFDKRLAHFLLEESALEGSAQLEITHEIIAGHLGTAREVVTRMLKYFQTEGLVKLSRGRVELTSLEGLRELSEK